MRSPILSLAAMTILIVVAVETVHAQGRGYRPSGRAAYRGTLTRPPVSPYLNLLRNDARAFPNYQTLVRPQIEQRNLTLQQGFELQQMQQEMQYGSYLGPQTQLPPTGNPAGFMIFSHFYQGVPQAGTFGAPAAGAIPGAMTPGAATQGTAAGSMMPGAAPRPPGAVGGGNVRLR